MFQGEELIDKLIVLGLIDNIEEYHEMYNHVWKSMNQEFGLEKIGETRTYLIEEINQNELMSKKHKKVCRVLNYIDHLFIVISTITGCVSISDFAFLVRIPTEITSSAIELTICGITAEIIKYNSIIKKNKKKHDKVVLPTKSKLNSIEDLICKDLIDSNISYNEFDLTNNALKEFCDMKEEIENSNIKYVCLM